MQCVRSRVPIPTHLPRPGSQKSSKSTHACCAIIFACLSVGGTRVRAYGGLWRLISISLRSKIPRSETERMGDFMFPECIYSSFINPVWRVKPRMQGLFPRKSQLFGGRILHCGDFDLETSGFCKQNGDLKAISTVFYHWNWAPQSGLPL